MRRPLISTFLLLSLLACSSGEGGASTYISAQVGGKYWSGPASDGVLVYTAEIPDGPGFVSTVAAHTIAGGKEFLALGLPTPPAVGSYSLDGLAAFATFSACPDQDLADCIYWKQVPGDPGTLSITHIEPTTGLIEGTFAFTAYLLGDSTAAKKSIMQGQFAIVAPSVFILE
jgi:hypothetical protein